MRYSHHVSHFILLELFKQMFYIRLRLMFFLNLCLYIQTSQLRPRLRKNGFKPLFLIDPRFHHVMLKCFLIALPDQTVKYVFNMLLYDKLQLQSY